ncbi:YciI family protein [Kribbella sp. NBC_01245]|uniref:YciI family protein n=1 Tax=Kribbella sp. NBC_01245 TaxID=2903578 RepID=UPI002E27D016|nr:YciI family protein [Kribbella sp. NBC_01245]
MKYLLLIWDDPDLLPDVTPEALGEATAWVDEMHGRGVRLVGDRLRPQHEAVQVRVRSRKVVTTDGPFAEAKEQMGGFDLLECRDLDEAIEVASKHPAARTGLVELRQLWG